MKTLTVRQPWAWAIARGHKNIENRSWTTNYRGPLAIHAAKQFDDDPALALLDVRMTIRDQGGTYPASLADDLPYSGAGLILAIVELTGVCTASRERDSVVCECGPWARPTSVHWQLGSARPLPEPFKATGRLGLWDCEVPHG